MSRTMPLLGILAFSTVGGPAVAQSTRDHLSCFAVRDAAPKVKYQVTATTAAGQQVCTVKTPAKLACVESTKSNVTPTPQGGGPSGASAAGAFLCYPAKCPKPGKAAVNAQDQFGNRVIRFGAAKLLCAPAFVAAPTPGAPTTTSTTIPGGGGDTCTFNNGACEGSCGAPGARCRAAVNTGSCECRSVACGDADSPSCDGACSEAGEACVFGFTGCRCVRIP